MTGPVPTRVRRPDESEIVGVVAFVARDHSPYLTGNVRTAGAQHP